MNDYKKFSELFTELGVKHYTYSGVSEEKGNYSCIVVADPNSDKPGYVPLFTFNYPDKKLIEIGVRWISP